MALLLSRKSAALVLGVHYNTIERLIKSGELPTLKPGAQVLISRAALEAYAAQGVAQPQPAPANGTGNGALRLSIGLDRKVGLPNYGSAAASIHLSGLTPETTEEEIANALETGKLAWPALADALRAKIAEQVKKEETS